MEKTPFKILTIRDAVAHTDVLYSLMDSFDSKSAASSLIKGGYAYLQVKAQLEQLKAEHSQVWDRVRKMREGTSQFFESFEKMKVVVSG